MNPKLYGLSDSNMQQSHNVVNRFKNVKLPYLQVFPIRTMSFSVATALGSINSTNLGKRDSPSKMYFMTIDKIQNKRMKFENCRRFSSSEKPTSTQSSSLADEIMKSKMKETSQEKTPNAEETNENSDKGRQPMSKWQKRGYIAFVIFLSGALVVNAVLFSLPDRDEEGKDIPDEFSELSFPSQYYLRLKNKIFKTKKDLEEPFSDKLLPDPLPEPYHQPKYTVLLELTGLLVHSNWTHKHGWRFQKRPGVDIFVSQIGYPNFEVVVWTVENSITFYPIILGMDPQQQHIMYKLYRDATHYNNGVHVKQLSNLNRDLRKVIVLDWDENTVSQNRDNALILKKWDGDNTDRTLIGLAQLLHEIKDSGLEDVRDVLTYYRQFDDPIEAFRENQRKLEEELKLEEERKLKEKESSRLSSFPGIPSFSRFRR